MVVTSTYPDAQTRRRRVLVVVVNNARDLQRAADEGWYRIPQRRAPRRIGADYLALYQTGAFKGQPEAQTVTYYAPVVRYQLLPRRALLPEEADHPRAEDYYFRIELGPLQRLAQPIAAGGLHRITFIQTSLDRLLTARTVGDLYLKTDPFESLWQALREGGLRPLRNRLVGELPVDIALRARSGSLGIVCRDENQTQEPTGGGARWVLLTVPLAEIEQDLARCLRRIGAALLDLGGSLR